MKLSDKSDRKAQSKMRTGYAAYFTQAERDLDRLLKVIHADPGRSNAEAELVIALRNDIAKTMEREDLSRRKGAAANQDEWDALLKEAAKIVEVTKDFKKETDPTRKEQICASLMRLVFEFQRKHETRMSLLAMDSIDSDHRDAIGEIQRTLDQVKAADAIRLREGDVKHVQAMHDARCAIFSAEDDADFHSLVWRYRLALRSRTKFCTGKKKKLSAMGIQEFDVVSSLTDASKKRFETVKGAFEELMRVGKFWRLSESLEKERAMEAGGKGKRLVGLTTESIKEEVGRYLDDFRKVRTKILEEYRDLVSAEGETEKLVFSEEQLASTSSTAGQSSQEAIAPDALTFFDLPELPGLPDGWSDEEKHSWLTGDALSHEF